MSFDKNYLNIHVLTSHNPSCLNRDDMNMQKSAVFGGVRRVRISSQCLKRAIRHSEQYRARLGEPSTRTLALDHLATRLAADLEGECNEQDIRKTIALIAGKEDVPDKGDAVAPWSVAEVARLCKLLCSAEAEGLDEKKLKKLIEKESVALRQAMAKQVDIALSGRMATSGLMTTVDGAMSVAHAITTHAVDADVDWFTAVDDLTIAEGETGAGHLNTQEFGSGVFYRYASFNLPQLAANMGEAEAAKPLDVAAHMVTLLATVVPEAKQRSFAAFNPADLVVASFGDMPISAANAFEKPVTTLNGGGFRQPSADAFTSYFTKVNSAYSLDGKIGVVAVDVETDLQPRFDTLAELEDWVRQGGN